MGRSWIRLKCEAVRVGQVAMCDADVLLGVGDEEVADYDTDFTTSKVGGAPDWPDPASPPPLPLCAMCSASLSLICQIYCPLAASPYHRTLYVFACTRPQCWNVTDSWCVIRCQKLADSNVSDNSDEITENGNLGLGVDDWGDDADDWGDSTNLDNLVSGAALVKSDSDTKPTSKNNVSELITAKNSIEDQLQDLSIKDTSSSNEMKAETESTMCIPEDLPSCPEYMAHIFNVDSNKENKQISEKTNITLIIDSIFIHVQQEPFTQLDSLKHENALLQDYARREGLDIESLLNEEASGGIGGGEQYEKSVSSTKERLFYKFRKRLALCPEQILRYSWSGQALPITSLTKEDHERTLRTCQACGAKCIFELQLMPNLVPLLKCKSVRVSGVVVEFGTVLVYSCLDSCWSMDTVCRTEQAVVQADPDQHAFNRTHQLQ